MKKKIKIGAKDIKKLKPIIFEQKRTEKEEQIEDDFEDEQFQQRPPNFNSSILPFKAPILEKTNIPENLESGVSNAPASNTAQNTTPGTHKELTYVQNLPKYSSADYTSKRTFEMSEDRDTRRDREVNIARAQEFTVTAANPQNRNINMGLWQRENIFNRPDMQKEEDDRDYVLRAQEKKDKDKLPFQ